MTSIRVEYARKIGQPDFSSVSIGGAVEVTVPDGAEWQPAYNREFANLRQIVDSLAVVPSEGGATRQAAPASAANAQQPAATTELSQIATIVPKAPVAIAATVAGKVWHNNQGTRKEYVKVRITSPQIPGNEVDMKCFDLAVIPSILALREGDTFIVKGYFDDPYNGKNDLRAQEVQRT